ncbi:TLD-domain-containing protein, partial [Vararia minispora EC-137]
LPIPASGSTAPVPIPTGAGRASTLGRATGLPQALATSFTHGTPFAPHTFVPASGAPGFAGDRTWDKGFEFDPDLGEDGKKRGVSLNGRTSMTAGVLDVDLADQLRLHLPALARLPTTWRLLYSLDQHGISLHTLYARCGAHNGGVVFVAKDGNGGIFGAWLGQGIHFGRGESYFGSGESFLWRVKRDAPGLDVFKWTGKNDYVALCEREYIAFGGGDGTYGLYLDESLFDGSSAPCPTFENEVLCVPSGHRMGRTEGFECVGVEVWGVG